MEKHEILAQNRAGWNAMADSWYGTTALPKYGCSIPDEDTLHLFPDLRGARVLDLGCGSGHSLRWCAEQGAAELWGVDISSRQLENARRCLGQSGLTAHLTESSMEAVQGLPEAYFDVIYSIYAIGWTTDLEAVLRRAAGALKWVVSIIFSWDHPLMHCVDVEGDRLIFTGKYTSDESFSYMQRGQPVTVQNRRMSTYINALADAGFAIERLIEETDPCVLARAVEFSSGYYCDGKAQHFPLSFVIKARKL